MYRTVPLIAQRLAAALGPGWAIGHGNAAQDRLPLPRADVRLAGAALRDAKARAVHLQATYRVALVIEAAQPDSAFAALDDAVTTLIAALHQWQPKGHLPATARLELRGVAEMDLLIADVYGYELTFVLGTVRHGFDPAAADPFAAPVPPTPAPTPTPTPTP